VLDGIVFEKVGIPAASIVTDVFEATGHAIWGSAGAISGPPRVKSLKN
jgi:hypothetical protein